MSVNEARIFLNRKQKKRQKGMKARKASGVASSGGMSGVWEVPLQSAFP